MVQEKTYRIVDRERSDGALHDEGFIEAFAACADILGACFVFHPVKERASDAFAMLRDIDVAIDWPFGEESARVQAARHFEQGAGEVPEAVSEEFTRLLRGAGFSPAPPWGSVYMDREKVMYGRTWVMLRDWMRAHGVSGLYAENDPEDQFGRLLVLAAKVARDRPIFCASCSATTCCVGRTVFSGHFRTPRLPVLIAVWLYCAKRRLTTCESFLRSSLPCAGYIGRHHGNGIQRRVACGIHGARPGRRRGFRHCCGVSSDASQSSGCRAQQDESCAYSAAGCRMGGIHRVCHSSGNAGERPSCGGGYRSLAPVERGCGGRGVSVRGRRVLALYVQGLVFPPLCRFACRRVRRRMRGNGGHDGARLFGADRSLVGHVAYSR